MGQEQPKRKAQCRANKLTTISRVENNEDCFLLNLLMVQREQQKELSTVNFNLSTYISDQVLGYSMQDLDGVNII